MHKTLNQLNDKLLFKIKLPPIDVNIIADNFFRQLEIGIEGIVTMCIYSPHPSIPMQELDFVIKMMMEQLDYPLAAVDRRQELNVLHDACDVFGPCQLEKMVYQYLVAIIPKYMVQKQNQHQHNHMALHMFNNLQSDRNLDN